MAVVVRRKGGLKKRLNKPRTREMSLLKDGFRRMKKKDVRNVNA